MSSVYRSNRFEVRLDARQLLVDGKPALLGARAFDVLQALLARRDRVVSKNELLDLVWPGLIVEENNLQVQISTLRKLLGSDAIATIPGRGYRLTAPIIENDAVRAMTTEPEVHEPPSAAIGNLTAVLPPLYGREQDLRALTQLVQKSPLVTIAGAGGIGKTRLAQSLAHALRATWSDGAWIVDLASTVNADGVAGSVAHAMGLSLPGRRPILAELLDWLRPLRALIVLDNCEHLLEACAVLVRSTLAQASGIAVLTTSQEPLHLLEEHVYRLNTLAVPATADGDGARTTGAVALFVARAAAADPRFSADSSNIESIIAICRQLDGLPLAIELAAARVPLLGVEGVRARLNDSFRLLTGGARFALRRHQTLRAALEWSYGLLSAAEQSVFARLGVFIGGFALSSAQQVARGDTGDEWDVLDHLSVLVDKSLVQVDMGAAPRYRLLETTRAFALEKLRETGKTEDALRSHAEAMVRLFDESYEQRWSLPSQTLCERYLPDLDNVRVALDWTGGVESASELTIALMGACAWSWVPAGARLEGLRRHEAAMSRIGPDTPAALEARLLLGFSSLFQPAQSAKEAPLLHRAAELYRTLGDRQGLFSTLVRRATTGSTLAEAERDLAEAAMLMDPAWPPMARRTLLACRAALLSKAERLDECWEVRQQLLRLDESIGDPRMIIRSMANLADLTLARDDLDEAIRLGRDALDYRRREWKRMHHEGTFIAANLGAALTRAGQLDEALQILRESYHEMQATGLFVYFLEHYALIALKRGRITSAARTVGHIRAFHRNENIVGQFNERRALADVMVALQQALPEAELTRLLSEGEQMGADEAARCALDE